MDLQTQRILLGSSSAVGGEIEDYWAAFYLNGYVRIEATSLFNNDDCRLAVDGLGNVAFRFINDATYAGGLERYNVVKFDDTGSLIFQKRFDDTDRNGGMKFDSQNNLYLSYTSIYNNPNSLAQSVGLMQLNSAGGINWQVALGDTTRNNAAGRMAFDSSDNIYVESKFDGQGSDKWGFAKFNSSGSYQSSTGTSFTTATNPTDIKIDSSNNIYVMGETGSPYKMGTVVKFNSAHTIQWARKVEGSSENRQIFCLALDGSENILQLTNGTFNPSQAAHIQKWDSSGNLQWQRSIRGNSNLPAFVAGVIACDSSDNVYLGGTFSNGSSAYYAIIVKLNSSGAKVWERALVFSDSDTNLKTQIVDMVVKKNAIYVYGVGQTESAQILPFIVKVPTDGSLTTPLPNGLTISEQAPYLYSDMIFKYENYAGATTVTAATDTIGAATLSFPSVGGFTTATTTRTTSPIYNATPILEYQAL